MQDLGSNRGRGSNPCVCVRVCVCVRCVCVWIPLMVAGGLLSLSLSLSLALSLSLSLSEHTWSANHFSTFWLQTLSFCQAVALAESVDSWVSHHAPSVDVLGNICD